MRERAGAPARETKGKKPGHFPISKGRLEAMIEQAMPDYHNESEQVPGWFTMIEENLAVPALAVPALDMCQFED